MFQFITVTFDGFPANTMRMPDIPSSSSSTVFDDFLRRAGLMSADETPRFTALTGGISSDIWRVDLPGRQLCIKRALEKLKVADDWFAPISRNVSEVAWLQTAGAIVPCAAPEVLADDPENGMFAMQFVPPDRGQLWKDALRNGEADVAFAADTGRTLATIHAATTARPELAECFATDSTFHAIRLEPYLETTARRHPDVAGPLNALVTTTAATKLALVHGDISPKNIMITVSGPMFLDAECAWWGDPAFDLAFCLNHFLLKCLWVPEAADAFLRCYQAMADTYVTTLSADIASGTEFRAAHLLPGLFLARIDGKSPVEYITDDRDKNRVRRIAKKLLKTPVENLSIIREIWADEIGVST
jgi:aminoglycoside phosphotransferase (APT) family kinase protein